MYVKTYYGLYLYYMRINLTKSQLNNVVLKYITLTIKGFDECDYDWAEFNCGMGVCCDPYAIGFVLPDKYYNDYLFKLVNSKFYDDDGDYPEDIKDELPEVCNYSPDINDSSYDTIIIYEDLYSSLRNVFGHIDTWRNSLLDIINTTYGLNATDLLSDVLYDW